MRPRKLILFITRDEQTLSLTSYVLRMHHKVIASRDADEGLLQLSSAVDLLITDDDAVIIEAKRRYPYLRTLSMGAAWYADQRVEKSVLAADLLPLVKRMVARKRGPRKHVGRVEERKAA